MSGYIRGRQGRDGRGFKRGGFYNQHKDFTQKGPPILKQENPTHNEIAKWSADMQNYLEGQGGVIKIVYIRTLPDETKSVEKMSLIFGEENKLGRYPIIEAPQDLEHVVGEHSIIKDLRVEKWKISNKLFEDNSKGWGSERSMIAGIFKDCINNNVQNIMRKSADGRNALDDILGMPLEILNMLKTTDFSRNAIGSLNDHEKYFQAYKKFTDKDFRQHYEESLNEWKKRFNNEVNNLKLLAQTADKGDEVPSELTLSSLFLDRLNGLYNKLRDDLDKGVRTDKPKTVEEVVNLAIVYDRPGKSSRDIDTPYRGVYNVGRGRGRESRANGVQWKCKVHKTDTHQYWDDTCKAIIAENSKRQEAAVNTTVEFNRGGRGRGRSNRGRGGRGRGRWRG
jgi:hypothetical protein